ncbi:hypothetical protein AZI98_07355 [Aeribacillus pallidus]|uniref:Oxidoreductase n=1 Tax=Aeribacillus pallidus TaxID=33936 RepID=A0A165Y455_9BACI|nr:Gfo/Idh/MocA family oxidoreductase [Aeribacillus pallidus]KZN96710.1 hypothetical protein AZI98_07355 [Aeribacillus pallidus]
MEKVKWGIMSAANIAYEQLLPALRQSSRSEVVAIASRSKEKVARFNIPKVYSDYDQLLEDESIDVVYIPLPNALHAEWAIKAAQKGKHILVEKPAAVSTKELLKVQEAVEQNNVIFMEAFMYQFHKQHARVKDLLASGMIGNILHVKSHFSWSLQDRDDIRLNPALGGGAMWDVGCYGVHAMSQIIGIKPEKVVMLGEVDPEHKVDMLSTCIFVDEFGRTAEITASMKLPFINRYEIIGERGTILVDSSFRPDVSSDQKGKVIVKDDNNEIILFETYKDNQYFNQVEHVNDCIINGKQPVYGIRNSIQVIHYIEKGYESLRNQSVVTSLNKF